VRHERRGRTAWTRSTRADSGSRANGSARYCGQRKTRVSDSFGRRMGP
jgi:hypothetical protein